VDVPLELDTHSLMKALISMVIMPRIQQQNTPLQRRNLSMTACHINNRMLLKKRDTTHNITEADYMVVKSMIENNVCHMCGEGFDLSKKPTLDRKDNSKGHSLDNVKLCCLV
jgi:hypothetical protein